MEKDLKTNLDFQNNQSGLRMQEDLKNIENGLKKIGFSDTETQGILGNNWYNFYKSI
jgi:microsomal dipeptidase-like Zn-dependent dipeptidase